MKRTSMFKILLTDIILSPTSVILRSVTTKDLKTEILPSLRSLRMTREEECLRMTEDDAMLTPASVMLTPASSIFEENRRGKSLDRLGMMVSRVEPHLDSSVALLPQNDKRGRINQNDKRGRTTRILNRSWSLMIALSCLFIYSSILFAQSDDLLETNDEDGFSGPPAATSSSPLLTPIGHDTNYEPQFSSYSSFMQSPYQNQPANRGPAPSQNSAAPNANNDPLMASEVSPYSKYSPYLEIQGEGSNYTLGIDDVVTIIVREQPDFSGRYIVDPEGNLQYNFVGNVKAQGKTKDQLKVDLIERLKKFVRYPEVAVMISEYRSKAVYVFGYVNAPGKYAMKGDKITVKDAVVAAGLPRFDGALKRVYVIRPTKNTDGKEKIEEKKVNLKKLLYKGETIDNFYLQPGDTIVVNQRYFDKFINNFSRIVGPVFQAAAVYELGYGNGSSKGFLRKD